MDLRRQLTDWVREGLITPDQADAIWLREDRAGAPMEGRAHAVPDRREGRGSLLAEAVGYLGAVLTVAAAGLVLGEFWDQLTGWARIVLAVVLTLVVFAAGWVLRTRSQPAIKRLTSVLWFATVIGVTFVAGLTGEQLGLDDRPLPLVVGLVTTVVAMVLHRLRPTALQLVAVSLGVVGVAMSGLAYPRAEVDAAFYGLLLWALGVAWVLVAVGGWLHPPRTALVLGMLGIGVGCQVAVLGSHEEVAVVVALLSCAALLWLAVAGGETMVLAFAAAGVFVFTPQAVFTFFGESIGAALALLLTGLLLVGGSVALVTLRREITAEESP